MADKCRPLRLKDSITLVSRGTRTWLRALVLVLLAVVIVHEDGHAASEITVVYANSHARFPRLFALFSEQTGIAVKSEFIDTALMRPELLIRANRQMLPDAVIFSADNLNASQLAFSRVRSNLFSANLDQRVRGMVEFEGVYRGIPVLVGNHLMLYYNKGLLDRAPDTLPDFAKAGRSRTPLVAFDYGSMYWFLSFAGACGGFPLQDGAIRLDTPEMRAALQLYSNIASAGTVNPGNNYQEAKDGFLKGKVPCLIDGDWAYGELLAAYGNRLGVARLPDVGGRRLASYCTAQALAFPNRSLQGPKSAALLRLAEFMQSAAVQRRIWSEIGALPVTGDAISELLSSGNEQLKDIYRAYETAVPLPVDANMAVIWEVMQRGVTRYSGGWYDAGRATAYMQHLAIRSAGLHPDLPVP